MSLVSVVIPAYNAEKTLAMSVLSVLHQEKDERHRFEIIVVDDGSTDFTARVAETLAGRYPGLIRVIHQKNAGPAAARNAGIQAARGEYIAFLDADDLWLPNKLQLQLEILEAAPEIDLVCTAMNGRRFLFSPAQFILRFRDLLPNNIVYTSSVVAKKSTLITAGGFNEARRYSEDFELWLRIAHVGTIVVLNIPLIRYTKYRGLSSKLWPMEKGELETYAIMCREGWISVQWLTILRWWSLLKYLVRRIRWSI
jgi:glycosyltransferase involved in cell wall biosynthesis